jgi:hypothetical protein
MRKLIAGVIILAAVVAVLAVLSRVGVRTTATEEIAFPRTADGKPDLNGIWQTMGTANWDLEDHSARSGAMVPLGAVGAVPAGRSVVEGGEIPYQPWALAKRKENADNWLTRDPEIKCYMPGVPRAMYLPLPFQIVQSPNLVLMTFEYAGASRPIHMEQVEAPPIDTWMGHSRGRWEGDTLIIESDTFNDQTWFDRAGNFHSEGLHVVERYTPIGPNHIQYEATIEDPKVFTRPWKISFPLYRRMERGLRVLDYECYAFGLERTWYKPPESP